MEKRYNILFKVLKEFQKEKILEYLILIGSWSQFFYKKYFNNTNKIPNLKTLDLDFLVPNPPKIKIKTNIPKLLKNLEFETIYNKNNDICIYSHPELNIEFLINEKGRGDIKKYSIKELTIEAEPLRYLSVLENNIIIVKFENIKVKVPEPSAYVLHKLLIYDRRKDIFKSKKDIKSIIDIGNFIVGINKEKGKIIKIFKSLPYKWQKDILEKLSKNEYFNFLDTIINV